LKLMDNSLNLPERQQREIKNNENSPNKSSRKYLIANKLI